jgi:hypothetical protein
VGLGGLLALDYPEQVDLGFVAAGQWSQDELMLTNTGDVTLQASFKLDRTSIQAESNSDSDDSDDSEADGDGDDDQEQKDAEGADTAVVPRSGASSRSRSRSGRAGGAGGALVPSGSSSSSSSSLLSSSSSLFAIKLSPRKVVVSPRSSASVQLRVWVPLWAVGLFDFRVAIRLPEATLMVQLRGVGTVVRLSGLARGLIEQEREQMLQLLRTPHPFASSAASATALGGGGGAGALSPRQHSSLLVDRALSVISRRGVELNAASFSAASSAAPSRRDSRSSTVAVAGPQRQALDADLVVAAQVLESLLLVLESASDSHPAARVAAAVSRTELANASADVLCPPHAAHSLVPLKEAQAAGDDSVSRRGSLGKLSKTNAADAQRADKKSKKRKNKRPATPQSFEAREAARLDAAEAALAAAANAAAGAMSLRADESDDRDGVLLGVVGVTHLVSSSSYLVVDPLRRLAGEDDVVRHVLRCEPRHTAAMRAPSYAALLRPVEPRGPDPRALALFPALLAPPPAELL